jgi:hypothetical protein
MCAPRHFYRSDFCARSLDRDDVARHMNAGGVCHAAERLVSFATVEMRRFGCGALGTVRQGKTGIDRPAEVAA